MLDQNLNFIWADQCFYDDEKGSDLSIKLGLSKEECRTECRDDKKCSHVTWYRQKCFLKSSKSISTTKLARISDAMCGFQLELSDDFQCNFCSYCFF